MYNWRIANIWEKTPARNPYLASFVAAAITLVVILFAPMPFDYLLAGVASAIGAVAALFGGRVFFNKSGEMVHSCQRCQAKGAFVLGLFCVFAAPLYLYLISLI